MAEAPEIAPENDAARDRLQVRLNTVVNAMAGRDDLLLSCVWNKEPLPGQPSAPAWFDPATARVTVNAAVAIGDADPDLANPQTRAGRSRHPALVGLVAHEASHAHSTQWPDLLASYAAPVRRAMTLLEEPRIEGRQIARRPQDRPFLRAQSVLLDLSPFEDAPDTAAESRWQAANAAVMVCARVDAGVLDPDDAATVVPLLRDALGADLDQLRLLWQEALALADGDVAGLADVAERWVDVVGEPPSPGLVAVGCAADPAEGDDRGWYDPDAPQDSAPGGTPLGEALATALAAASEDADAEIAEESEAAVEGAAAADASRAAADQHAKDVAKQTAARKQAERARSTVTTRKSRPVRPPDAADRRLATTLGQALRRAQFRERATTVRPSDLPPGRLNGRDLMLGAAQRARGALVTAQPFRQPVRRHVPEPPLSVGLLVDESGSMGWAEDVMSRLAWALAHAVGYVHGTTAAVGFDEKASIITAPGERPHAVTEFSATGGWENFSSGFALVDGMLNLSMGRGVRMLIVVSDGQFVGAGQREAAEEATARLRRNGAYVLWCSLHEYTWVPDGAVMIDIAAGLRGRAPAGSGAGDVEGALLEVVPAALGVALTTALRR